MKYPSKKYVFHLISCLCEYRRAAVNMLLFPLPEGTSMPRSFSLFLTGLIKLLWIDLSVTSNGRTSNLSTENLESFFSLLLAHPGTVSELVLTLHQKAIYSVLSHALVNSELTLKCLAIASLSRLSQFEHPGSTADNPQSLFEGVKGAKVLRLSLSTVLGAVTPGNPPEVKLVKLCSTALQGICSSVFASCAAEPTFYHHISKLRAKAEGLVGREIIPVVVSVSWSS